MPVARQCAYAPRVLLWINGPFGGGKTQVAHEVTRRLPGSIICDPEDVGFGLHRMTPRHLRGDFQDLASWRSGVREVLDLVLRRHDGVVIAPMTLVDPRYFDEIVPWLRDRGHDVRHVALMAERETVLRRLHERGYGHVVQRVTGRAVPLRRETFAISRLDGCLAALQDARFHEHIWTDRPSVEQVAEAVAASAGLALLPERQRPVRARVRRAWIGVKHLRLE